MGRGVSEMDGGITFVGVIRRRAEERIWLGEVIFEKVKVTRGNGTEPKIRIERSAFSSVTRRMLPRSRRGWGERNRDRRERYGTSLLLCWR